MHSAAPEDARDARRARERAGHERDATVLAHMRDRLDAAPRQVEVGDAPRTEHAQCVVSLGRQIDVAVIAYRRGGNEEHGLCTPPLGKVRRKLGEPIGHASIVSARVVHERTQMACSRSHATGSARPAPSRAW